VPEGRKEEKGRWSVRAVGRRGASLGSEIHVETRRRLRTRRGGSFGRLATGVSFSERKDTDDGVTRTAGRKERKEGRKEGRKEEESGADVTKNEEARTRRRAGQDDDEKTKRRKEKTRRRLTD